MHSRYRILISIILFALLTPITHARGSCSSHSSKPLSSTQQNPSLANPNYHPNLETRHSSAASRFNSKRSLSDPSYLLPSYNPPLTSSPDAQISALATCLATYRARNWGTWRCGGYEWYRRGDGYYGGGASQCTNSCTCLNDAVNGGLSDAECVDETGAFKAGGRCWMGFRPLAGGVDVG